jgi:hypothetical protein
MLFGIAQRRISPGHQALSKAHSRRYVTALIAAIALIAVSALHSRHDLGNRLHEQQGHCDLCLHLSGTAGSPACPALLGKPVLVVRVVLTPEEILVHSRRKAGIYLPRGPPHSPGLI